MTEAYDEKEEYHYCFLPPEDKEARPVIELTKINSVKIRTEYKYIPSTDLEGVDKEFKDLAKEYFKKEKIELPDTLPDHLRKEFEDYTVTATQFNCYDEPHEFETNLLWDDLCVIYETLRELILDGKLKEG